MNMNVTTYTALDSTENYLRLYVNEALFLDYCRQCPNFGCRWSCPPFDFNVEDFWRRFTWIRLIFQKIDLPSLAGKTDAESAAQAAQIRRRVKDDLLCRLFALERAYPGSYALSAGSCSLCWTCGRTDGAACRRPAEMRHSIEALGGDVGKTAGQYFGLELLWSKDGSVPAYSVIAGALLIR